MSSGVDINLPAILFEPSPSPNPRRRPLIFDPAGLAVEAVSARLLRVHWNYPADRFEAAQAQAFDGCVWLRASIDNDLFILGQVIWQPVGEVLLTVPQSEGSYRIDLGLYRHAGDWFHVVRSNPIQTPPDAVEAASSAPKSSDPKCDSSLALPSFPIPKPSTNGTASEHALGVDASLHRSETTPGIASQPSAPPPWENFAPDGETARSREQTISAPIVPELGSDRDVAPHELPATPRPKPSPAPEDHHDRDPATPRGPTPEASPSENGAVNSVPGPEPAAGSSSSFPTTSSWSGESGASKRWFRLGMDLVLYGTAETPGSILSIAGQPVEVRADGSFSFRIALPDGRFELPVAIASNSGPLVVRTVVDVSRMIQTQPSELAVEIL